MTTRRSFIFSSPAAPRNALLFSCASRTTSRSADDVGPSARNDAWLSQSIWRSVKEANSASVCLSAVLRVVRLDRDRAGIGRRDGRPRPARAPASRRRRRCRPSAAAPAAARPEAAAPRPSPPSLPVQARSGSCFPWARPIGSTDHTGIARGRWDSLSGDARAGKPPGLLGRRAQPLRDLGGRQRASRQPHAPTVPGWFMRPSVPRPSASWIWIIAITAGEAKTSRISAQLGSSAIPWRASEASTSACCSRRDRLVPAADRVAVVGAGVDDLVRASCSPGRARCAARPA